MNENSLVYVGDPMCSWCYGFGVPLQTLLQQLPGVPLAVVLGGLRAYNKEVMHSTLIDTLHHHWEEVTKRSGKPRWIPPKSGGIQPTLNSNIKEIERGFTSD